MLAYRSHLRDYAVAMAVLFAAILFRALFNPVLGDMLPYFFFYFAVVVAAIHGGIGPAIVTLTAALLGATYLFAAPRYSFGMMAQEDLLGAFRFASIGLLLAFTGSWARRQQRTWRSHMEAKDKELDRTRREKNSTQQLLASIGDGLITVDLQGRVTFMNTVAEQLCGWSSTAAHGVHVEEVFPIVDEHSRLSVPNPALQVLKDGGIALLPENVTLLARNGVQRAIDDSAAPILDDNGNMTGSVLIFRDVTDRRIRGNAEVRPTYRLASLHLIALGGFQPISVTELQDLDRECRQWIMREWQPRPNAVRMVSLTGYNLIIRQERTEKSAAHGLLIHFTASYERIQG